MRRFNRLIVVVSMVGTLSGCAVSFDAGTLGVKVSMAEPAGQQPEGTEFTITKKAVEQDGQVTEIEAAHTILATGARARSLPGLEPDGRLVWTYKEAMVPESIPHCPHQY